MSTNERDTHFQGFARRLWIELLAHSTFERKSMHSAEYGAEMEQIIARRAYDLGRHIFYYAPITEYEYDINDVPDMAEWPKPD